MILMSIAKLYALEFFFALASSIPSTSSSSPMSRELHGLGLGFLESEGPRGSLGRAVVVVGETTTRWGRRSAPVGLCKGGGEPQRRLGVGAQSGRDGVRGRIWRLWEPLETSMETVEGGGEGEGNDEGENSNKGECTK